MKRVTLIILGVFLFFMGFDIYTKIDTFNQSAERAVNNIGLLINAPYNLHSPPRDAEFEQLQKEALSSTGDMTKEYLSLYMSLPSAITLMLVGAISVISGTFGRRFWRAIFEFITPTP